MIKKLFLLVLTLPVLALCYSWFSPITLGYCRDTTEPVGIYKLKVVEFFSWHDGFVQVKQEHSWSDIIKIVKKPIGTPCDF